MGFVCKIRLHRPSNGYFTTGGIVSGVINYSIDKPLSIKAITVSLKGSGKIQIRLRDRQKDRNRVFTEKEEYVNIEHNALDKSNVDVIPSGSHEIPFKFILPEDIPATFDYENYDTNRHVMCKIVYKVCIHFAVPGVLSFDKKFQQEIVIVRDSVSFPRYPTETMVLGERKKLFHVIKKNFIDIKVTMLKSVIPPGGTVHLEYEISNDSDLQLQGVKAKMQETYTFTLNKLVEKHYKDIPNTRIQSGSIAGMKTETTPLTFTVPTDAISTEHSKIVCRDYAIKVTVQIPGPHRNLILTVPFQVSNIPGEERNRDALESEDSDEPPSYWEAMGEYDDEDKT